jgi:hypothetical protein
MKQRLSFSFSAADIAVIKSASVFTCRNSQPNFPVSNTQKMQKELEKSQVSKFQRTGEAAKRTDSDKKLLTQKKRAQCASSV